MIGRSIVFIFLFWVARFIGQSLVVRSEVLEDLGSFTNGQARNERGELLVGVVGLADAHSVAGGGSGLVGVLSRTD